MKPVWWLLLVVWNRALTWRRPSYNTNFIEPKRDTWRSDEYRLNSFVFELHWSAHVSLTSLSLWWRSECEITIGILSLPSSVIEMQCHHYAMIWDFILTDFSVDAGLDLNRPTCWYWAWFQLINLLIRGLIWTDQPADTGLHLNWPTCWYGASPVIQGTIVFMWIIFWFSEAKTNSTRVVLNYCMLISVERFWLIWIWSICLNLLSLLRWRLESVAFITCQ